MDAAKGAAWGRCLIWHGEEPGAMRYVGDREDGVDFTQQGKEVAITPSTRPVLMLS